MKNLLKYVIFAAAAVLATYSNAGTKGSEAAGLITSTPKTRNSVEGFFEISMTGWDSSTETTFETGFPVAKDTPWSEMYVIAAIAGYSLESAALNALMALCKAAYAEGLAEYNKLRIETLTDSVTKAFQSLDTIDLRDDVNKITKRLEKKDTTDDTTTIYGGKGIFNVAGAQVDGKSIVSNVNDRLSLKGFDNLGENDYLSLPYFDYSNGNVTLKWNRIGYFSDGTSIDKLLSDGRTYKGFISIKGWSTLPPCRENLSKMLTDPLDSNNRNRHKILCRIDASGEGGIPEIHYLPIGDVISGVGKADETTITTNGVTKGVLQIKNGSQEKQVIASATGGDSAAPAWITLQEVTVIVGISKTTVDGVPKLSLTKKKIFVPYVEDITPNDVIDVADTVSVNAVLGTEYDDMTHQFYDQIGAVRVFGSTQPSSARRATPTFTAVEHATE